MLTQTAKRLMGASALALCTQAYAGDLFYRYQNASGESFIDSSAPNAEKAQKYEILNDEGKVLQVVNQTTTPTTAPIIAADESKETVLQKLHMLSSQDKALLAQFKNVKEIETLKMASAATLQEEIHKLKALRGTENSPESQQKLALQLQFKEVSLTETQTSYDKKISRYLWLTRK